MAEALIPYIVALSFANGGPLYINAALAPNEGVAGAMIATEFFQGGGTDKPLMGVSIGQLTPEFLRVALRAYEGHLPGDQNVVSLVPAAVEQPDVSQRDEMVVQNPEAFTMGQDYMLRYHQKRRAELEAQRDPPPDPFA